MNKATTATSHLTVLQQVMNAFTIHQSIRVRKNTGELLGPGYIAIMYGEVAFRMYSKTVSKGSHFIRMEEISEILPDHS